MALTNFNLGAILIPNSFKLWSVKNLTSLISKNSSFVNNSLKRIRPIRFNHLVTSESSSSRELLEELLDNELSVGLICTPVDQLRACAGGLPEAEDDEDEDEDEEDEEDEDEDDEDDDDDDDEEEAGAAGGGGADAASSFILVSVGTTIFPLQRKGGGGSCFGTTAAATGDDEMTDGRGG